MLWRRAFRAALVLMAASLCPSPSTASAPPCSRGSDAWGVVERCRGRVCNLVLLSAEGDARLTSFPAYEEILAFEVNASADLLLVWHRPNKAPKRKLTTFDLRSRKLLASIEPGFGGDFDWTPGDTIVHIWGCGVPGQHIRIYTRDLRQLFDRTTTGNEVSPDRRLLVTFPTVPFIEEPICVWDTATGERVHRDDALKPGTYWVRGLTVTPGRILVKYDTFETLDGDSLVRAIRF